MAESADGAEWTAVVNKKMKSTINAIAFGGGAFVALGTDGKIARFTESAAEDSAADSKTAESDKKKETKKEESKKEDSKKKDSKKEDTKTSNGWTSIEDFNKKVGLNSFGKIVYCEGKFIAIDYGYIAISSDGLTWTVVDTHETFRSINSGSYYLVNLSKIVYGNGMYIASGRANRIWYSTDCTAWTESNARKIFTDNNIYIGSRIAFGNGMFVAGATDKIVYSPDGITWTTVNIGTILDYTDEKGRKRKHGIDAIFWAKDKFVARISNGNGKNGKMATSPDGITWTDINGINDDTFVYDIIYGKDKFVAVGGHKDIAYSSDGMTWTDVDLRSIFGTNRINEIAWGNNKFVAVGQNGKMATSPDGIKWTAVDVSSIFSEILAGFSASGDYYYETPNIFTVVFGNDMFIAAGSWNKAAYSKK